ncbi:MAG: DUF3426 domain-containing protein [Sulfuritalea sp.]|nr:DUF3426 domain-containing protein [Sulfuritalea sp.]
MLTRCPDCATHFRVTAEQLKLRAGRVRCGECQHVFNALDTLIEEPAAVFRPPPAAPDAAPDSLFVEEIAGVPAPTLASAVEPTESPGETGQEDTLESVKPSAGERATAPRNPEPEAPPALPEMAIAAVEPASPDEPPIAASAQELPADEAEPWQEDLVAPLPRRWPWVVGSLLALLALCLQALLMYRVEMAVLWPESRPLLVEACNILGCDVGLPTKVAMVGIEASDLHPDTAQKGRLTLTATLKNRAPFVQQFPHLELTLTDTTDKAIVRKVLAPADYLPRTAAVDKGMTPNADLAVSITLDAGDLPASGYRLYIFYP